jgi:hypothetical protein
VVSISFFVSTFIWDRDRPAVPHGEHGGAEELLAARRELVAEAKKKKERAKAG